MQDTILQNACSEILSEIREGKINNFEKLNSVKVRISKKFSLSQLPSNAQIISVATDDDKEKYKKRAGVEGTMSQGVRVCGMRRSRYIGLAKTHLQHIITAAALNLIRVVEWLHDPTFAQTRISRCARLAP